MGHASLGYVFGNLCAVSVWVRRSGEKHGHDVETQVDLTRIVDEAATDLLSSPSFPRHTFRPSMESAEELQQLEITALRSIYANGFIDCPPPTLWRRSKRLARGRYVKKRENCELWKVKSKAIGWEGRLSWGHLGSSSVRYPSFRSGCVMWGAGVCATYEIASLWFLQVIRMGYCSNIAGNPSFLSTMSRQTWCFSALSWCQSMTRRMPIWLWRPVAWRHTLFSSFARRDVVIWRSEDRGAGRRGNRAVAVPCVQNGENLSPFGRTAHARHWMSGPPNFKTTCTPIVTRTEELLVNISSIRVD